MRFRVSIEKGEKRTPSIAKRATGQPGSHPPPLRGRAQLHPLYPHPHPHLTSTLEIQLEVVIYISSWVIPFRKSRKIKKYWQAFTLYYIVSLLSGAWLAHLPFSKGFLLLFKHPRSSISASFLFPLVCFHLLLIISKEILDRHIPIFYDNLFN